MERKPRTQGEHNFVDAMKNILKNHDGEMNRKQLAEEIKKQDKNVSEKSALSHLSTFREYLETEESFETEEKAEPPGNPTVYWRWEK